jgi:uncharacterized repeat protein (TIGR02543 family)
VKLAARRTSAALVAVATAGVSTLLFGSVPANAAPNDACGANGIVVAPGVCELVFTEDGTFTPTSQMGTFEVLLVGGGGFASSAPTTQSEPGYAAGGGGGVVRIVDFESPAPVEIEVGGPASSTTADDGAVTETALGGSSGSYDSASDTAFGGSSGLRTGAARAAVDGYATAGGAGVSASTTDANGGAGVVVDSIAGNGFFAGDERCFGGGGAAGAPNVQGFPGCGGGGPVDSTGGAVSDAALNSGGGAGATAQGSGDAAAGIAIVRWAATDVVLTFDAKGIGTAPASQTLIAGTAPQEPADPTAAGYAFGGWYTDAELTTLADFSAPVTGATTYYAKWSRALAATGTGPDVTQLAVGILALLGGAGLAGVAYGRRRKES